MKHLRHLLLLTLPATLHGQLLLTEIQSDGLSDFWELTNTGATTIDIGAYKWDDDSRDPGLAVVVPAGTMIASGESIVFTGQDAATFRTQWGIAGNVQVISGGPGLGGNDGIAFFDASDNELFFFTYGAGGFTRADGSPSIGGHAGISAGGAASQAAVWVASSGDVSPRYTFADGLSNGTFAATASASNFGSPGFSGFGVAPPSITLTIDITPSSFSESAANPVAIGTVTRTGDLSAPLSVTLASTDTSEATVPATVEILATESSATFDITAVDDSFPDGDQTVLITGSAPDATFANFEVTVQDDGDVLNIDVMLTEVQSDQESGAAGAEDYWELTNFGASPVDLSGYRWNDSGGTFAAAALWEIPSGTILAPGESVVFTEATPSDFRSNWGLPASVQVIQADSAAPGLGKGDGIRFFDDGGNEIFFFSYAVGGFTKEDGNPSIGENPLDPNDATDPGHAGLAAGGNETDAAIWVPTTGTSTPRYAAATGLNFGSFSAVGGADAGSPGRIDAPAPGSSVVAIRSASVEEGNGGTTTLSLPVSRNDAAAAFTVDYAVTGGSADGSDFTLAAGTLSFNAGGSLVQTIDLAVNGDTLPEDNETVEITLSNLVNSLGTTAIDIAVARGTIENDDLAFPPSDKLSYAFKGSVSLAGAEIPTFHPASKRAYTSTGSGIQAIDLTDPANPLPIGVIDLTTAPISLGSNDVSSVTISGNTLAASVIANPKTDPGTVVFLNATDGTYIGQVSVGSVPDHLAFTPDGSKLLVAIEGELATGINADPATDTIPGGISIIDVSGGLISPPVSFAGFDAFDSQAAALSAAGVRIFAGGKPSTDFEPEYFAVSADSSTAMVVLQEANAVAALDIATAAFTSVVPLGEKDFSSLRADFSDQDGAKNPQTGWPVFGLYMPDQIASYEAGGSTYYITANEGDDRDDFLPGGEGARLGSLDLDDSAFPDEANLLLNTQLGRLTVSDTAGLNGDLEPDGDLDRILAYGGRSFSILDAAGNIVFDSGDMIEMIVFSEFPNAFDDGRSDNKGPEPEGVTVASFAGGTYAFIGLERSDMVLVFDVTDPAAVSYITALSHPGDDAPEGMIAVSAADSPSGKPLLLVANEGSNTLTIFELDAVNKFTLELFHLADQEANAAAVEDAPRLSGILNALRAEDVGNDGLPDNTLTLSSGDAIIPGLFYEASGPVYGTAGIADIQIQNELGIQAIAFGNHEFDFGTAAIAALIDGSAAGSILGSDFTGTRFPYLSGNLNFAADANMSRLLTADHQAPQANQIAATTVIEVNGEKIGVVAATTPTLGTISSPGGVGITPQPFAGSPSPTELDALAAIIQTDVDALLTAEPEINKVILLAHMQSISIEQELATRLSQVDIIVAGGSNTRLFDANDRIRDGDTNQGTYPIILSDADANPIAVVNTDGSYKYLGRLVIDFDAAGNMIPSSYDESVSGAYATDAQGVTDLAAAALIDPEIQTIANEIGSQIIATDGNWFGVTTEFLNGNRSGGGTGGVRNQETNLGNLTADANLAAAQAADATTVMSLKNGGGIRASIGEVVVLPGQTEATRIAPTANPLSGRPEGGISQNAIQGALAFNNGLTLVTLTKQEIVALLEHGVAASTNVNSSAQGRFPQVGGMEMAYDLTAPAGSRLVSASFVDANGEITNPLVAGGNLVGNPDQEFRIVALNFMVNPTFDRSDGDGDNTNDPYVSGGDGYPFPNLNSDPSAGETGDPSVIARANRVDLVQTGVQTGAATFADDGSEQDALAEYLSAIFPNTGSPFSQPDVGRELDTRLQNLAFRTDDIFEGAPLGFDLWLALNSYSSDGINGDADGDGLEDSVEFFFNQNPNDSSDLGNLPTVTAVNGDNLLSFTTLDDAVGVTGRLESSQDLITWQESVPGLDYDVVSETPNGAEKTSVLRIITEPVETPEGPFTYLTPFTDHVDIGALGNVEVTNHGLVGVGRVSGDQLDEFGETMGAASGLFVTDWGFDGSQFSGTFQVLPDRGFNADVAGSPYFSNYAARVHAVPFTFTPYIGETPTSQGQIVANYESTTKFTYLDGESTRFTTGLNANATSTVLGQTVGTATAANGPGGEQAELISFDAEAIHLFADGSGFVSDEYGTYIARFDSSKLITGITQLPDSARPYRPAGTLNFDSTAAPTTGRRNNQGLEGMAVTPDGRRLIAMMQSALVQDTGTGQQGRFNTRLYIYDIVGDNRETPVLVAEHVVQLPRYDFNGNNSGLDRTSAQSEIVAISDNQLLMLPRDGNGLGTSTGNPIVMKTVDLVDFSDATNILGLFDDEGDQISPAAVLDSSITPARSTVVINLQSTSDLAKFGINVDTASPDSNTLNEKMEGFALVPDLSTEESGDFFLFVANDNDFQSSDVRMINAAGDLDLLGDQTVGGVVNDAMFYAYRISITPTDRKFFRMDVEVANAE